MTFRRGGFALIEMLVALGIAAATLAGILALFSFAATSARSQASAADLQQSVRTAQRAIVRHLRMAGRGGLPAAPLPVGVALAVRNGDPASGPAERLLPGAADSPLVASGSDVLTVRGVFSTPLYQVESGASALTLRGDPATSGSIRITDPSPGGIPQSLAPLREAAQKRRPEALLLVSRRGSEHFAVVELGRELADAAPRDDGKDSLTLEFRVSGGTHTDRYRTLSPAPSLSELGSVWQVGMLEEYRYYVRASDEDNPTTLCRARLYPGTGAPHAGSGANLAVPVADRVLDLQIALGVDRDGDGRASESAPPSPTDEWLFNSPADAAGDPGWNQLPTGKPARLLWIRVTTLGRGTRPEPGYLAPALGAIEDRGAEPSTPTDPEDLRKRSYRRWALTAIVELRNLS